MIRNQINPQVLPAEINRALSSLGERPLTDSEFRDLELDPRGPIAQYRRGTMGLDGLVVFIQQKRRAWGGDKTVTTGVAHMLIPKRGRANLKRDEVISEFVATLARQREDVMDFRKKVLQNRCLTLDQVEAWIRSHAEPATTKLTVIPSEAVERGIVPAHIDLSRALSIEFGQDELQFATGPDYVIRGMPVKMGGVLDRLRKLSQELTRQCDWKEAQGTLFVLTDRPPLMNAISSIYQKRAATPVLDRIVLTIDPEVSPREVLRLYRMILAEAPVSAIRLSDKRVRLAAFMKTRPRETYATSMKVWLQRNPDVQYQHESNFGKEAQIALEATRERTYSEMLEFTLDGDQKKPKQKARRR